MKTILHKTITSPLKFSEGRSFAKKHSERFLSHQQTGNDFYINYEILISPNGEDCVKIKYVEDQETLEYLESVTAGILDCIEVLNKKSLDVFGFDIVILNGKIHPVDFRPAITRNRTKHKFISIIGKWGIKTP